MKKLFIISMIALASCAKTGYIDNNTMLTPVYSGVANAMFVIDGKDIAPNTPILNYDYKTILKLRVTLTPGSYHIITGFIWNNTFVKDKYLNITVGSNIDTLLNVSKDFVFLH